MSAKFQNLKSKASEYHAAVMALPTNGTDTMQQRSRVKSSKMDCDAAHDAAMQEVVLRASADMGGAAGVDQANVDRYRGIAGLPLLDSLDGSQSVVALSASDEAEYESDQQFRQKHRLPEISKEAFAARKKTYAN